MGIEPAQTPAGRARRLLEDVLGPERAAVLSREGSLDIPSRLHSGRVYRLSSKGTLAYRDPADRGFDTELCIQPDEPLPVDDLVAMRYLLVTADEARLLRTANPIRCSLTAILRTTYREQRETSPAVQALAAIVGTLAVLLGALAAEIAVLANLLTRNPLLGLFLAALLALPALLGLVLVVMAIGDLVLALRRGFAGLRGWIRLSATPRE